MKLYVVRHGETDWNVMNKLQGKTDIELNQNGINQARKAKEELKNIEFDVIITSPLKRAKKTAEIINENKKIPLIVDNRIEERGFGKFEGTNPGDDPNFSKFEFWNYEKNVNYKNAETVVELCNRVWGLLDEVKEKYNDKNVLLVTHGGTMRTINAYFNGLNENGMIPRIEILNCGIKEYEF